FARVGFLIGTDDPSGLAVKIDPRGTVAQCAEVGSIRTVEPQRSVQLRRRDGAVQCCLDIEMDAELQRAAASLIDREAFWEGLGQRCDRRGDGVMALLARRRRCRGFVELGNLCDIYGGSASCGGLLCPCGGPLSRLF